MDRDVVSCRQHRNNIAPFKFHRKLRVIVTGVVAVTAVLEVMVFYFVRPQAWRARAVSRM